MSDYCILSGNFRGPPELQLPNVTGPLQMLPVCVFHGTLNQYWASDKC